MITASRGDRWEPGVELAALLRGEARQLTIAIGVANLLGGVLVAVFLSWVVPLPVPGPTEILGDSVAQDLTGSKYRSTSGRPWTARHAVP